MWLRTVIEVGVAGFLVLCAVLAYLGDRDRLTGRQFGLTLGLYLGVYVAVTSFSASIVANLLNAKSAVIALALGGVTGYLAYTIGRGAFEASRRE